MNSSAQIINPANTAPLEQEHVQLVAIPHHMAVIHPHTMQAEHPHQRAHHHICPQIDMEVEAGRIQIDFTLRHHHHNRGDNERNHVAHHQKSIDEEAPIGDDQYPLPGGFPQIFSATTGLGHLPSLSCSPISFRGGVSNTSMPKNLYNAPEQPNTLEARGSTHPYRIPYGEPVDIGRNLMNRQSI